MQQAEAMRHAGAVVVAGMLVVGGFAACGNAVVPVVRVGSQSSGNASQASASPADPAGSATPGAVTTTPAATRSGPTDNGTAPRPAPTTLEVGARKLRSWPTGVTLPDGVTLISVTTDDRGGSITMSAASSAALVGHLRSELAGVGLAIEVDTGAAFQFRGPGWSGEVSTADASVAMTWTVGQSVAGRRAEDLGLTVGVPGLMRYPAGATAANTRVAALGSSYDLVGRTPSELLAYYRGSLEPLFTITGDRAEDGVTTLTFTDSEYDSVVTATDTSFRVVHSRRR